MRVPVVACAVPILAASVLILLPIVVPATPPVPGAAVSSLPVRFEPNVGQFPPDVQYAARLGAHQLHAKKGEVVIELRHPAPRISPQERRSMRHRVIQRLTSPPGQARRVRMRLSEGRSGGALEHLEQAPGVIHYIVGSDRSKWRTNVPTYHGVRYPDVRPGVDLVLYGNPSTLEYDLVVRPGTRVEDIALEFVGADSIRFDGEGALRMQVGNFTLRHLAPRVYQEVEGRRQAVDARYVLGSDGRVGFRVGHYLAHLPLIVDPVVEVPGSGPGIVDFVAADAAGNSYVTGVVQFSSAAGEDLRDLGDTFVAKLTADGTLDWTTIIGGKTGSDDSTRLCPGHADVPWAIGLSPAGTVHVVGSTASKNLATINPLVFRGFNGAQFGGGVNDGWAAELSATGVPSYITYLGGLGGDAGDDPDTCLGASGQDFIYALAFDAVGRVYLTGGTLSPNFPVTDSASQKQIAGNVDAFLVVIEKTGTGAPTIFYSSYHGGVAEDSGAGVAVDSAGVVTIAGETFGSPLAASAAMLAADFDVLVAQSAPAVPAFGNTKPLQPGYGGGEADAFIASFNPLATLPADTLAFSTYLGGTGTDVAVGVGVDASHTIYVAGNTASLTDFPLVHALPTSETNGVQETFIVKITDASGSPELGFSTFVGGTDEEFTTGIAVTPGGDVYVSGVTYSGDFPSGLASDVEITGGGDGEVFVVKLGITPLAPEQPVLLYSTSLGVDPGSMLGISLAPDGGVLVAGATEPTTGARITDTALSIDIRQEALNPGKKGVIPVAILPSSTFDPGSQLDRSSLTFGRTGDEHSLRHCEGRHPASRPTGKALVCHFDAQASGFETGDTHGFLKGQKLEGGRAFGMDTIRIVPSTERGGRGKR